jgi:hypothetical protein
MPVLSVVSANALGVTTSTTMATSATTQSSASGTCSLTNIVATVYTASGVPSGTVTIEDEAGGSPVTLATATLGSTPQATFAFALTNGAHTLIAVYSGDSTHLGSTSLSNAFTISSQCAASFVVTVSSLLPASTPANTLSPGESGTSVINVVPLQSFVSTLTSPLFITISCAGLPDQSSCTFTPENVELLPGENSALTSSMVIATQAEGTGKATPPDRRGSSPITWAFLLPGALGLGGLAWGTRRNSWFKRLTLLALVSLVTMLGTTACNPRYYYLNHGPQTNTATPAGTYTVYVTAQASNGVTAITNSTTMSVTVN